MKHIDQIYACTKVEHAAELYYICELGKYLHYYYNESLSLDGVEFDEVLRKSVIWDYYRLALDNKWVENSPIYDVTMHITLQDPLDADTSKVINVLYTEDDVAFDQKDFEHRQDDALFDFCTPLRKQISFESKEDEQWVWSIQGKDGEYFRINNDALNKDLARQLWLSLIAYVAVHKLFHDNKPNVLWLKMTNQTTYNITALSYITILTEHTACFLNEDGSDYWVKVDAHEVSLKELNQFGYVAWYMLGLDKGYLNHWFSKEDKLNRMKELDIKEGDFVMLYEREKAQKLNYVKEIAGCTLANIRKIEDGKFYFDLIHTMKPRMSAEIEFSCNDANVREMYNGVFPYEKLNVSKKVLDIIDCGVEYCMQSELFFIVPLSECYDEVVVPLVDSDENVRYVSMPQNDLIYWVAKDYNYDELNPNFSFDRFVKKNFTDKGIIPLYKRYYSGDISFYEEYEVSGYELDTESDNF